MHKPFRSLIPILLLTSILTLAHPTAAQSPPEPEEVEITTPDDVTLVGSLFTPPSDSEDARPAVILIHNLGSARGVWTRLFVPDLMDAGYVALAIDVRGHGNSGGERGSLGNWQPSEDDIHLWIAWLRDQPGIDPDRISIVGTSLGANLGLRVMANDERMVTVVAISPDVEAQGVRMDGAMEALSERPVFLIASQDDSDGAADSVRTLMTLSQGDVMVRLYNRNGHGTGLFPLQRDLAPAIIAWLDIYN